MMLTEKNWKWQIVGTFARALASILYMLAQIRFHQMCPGRTPPSGGYRDPTMQPLVEELCDVAGQIEVVEEHGWGPHSVNL